MMSGCRLRPPPRPYTHPWVRGLQPPPRHYTPRFSRFSRWSQFSLFPCCSLVSLRSHGFHRAVRSTGGRRRINLGVYRLGGGSLQPTRVYRFGGGSSLTSYMSGPPGIRKRATGPRKQGNRPIYLAPPSDNKNRNRE